MPGQVLGQLQPQESQSSTNKDIKQSTAIVPGTEGSPAMISALSSQTSVPGTPRDSRDTAGHPLTALQPSHCHEIHKLNLMLSLQAVAAPPGELAAVNYSMGPYPLPAAPGKADGVTAALL